MDDSCAIVAFSRVLCTEKPHGDILCPMCRTGLRGILEVEQHLSAEHKLSKALVCWKGTCRTRFSSVRSLRRHVQERHECVAKTVICQECGYVFGTERMMKHHVLLVHGSEKESRKFGCHLCTKTYKYRYSLTRHMEGAHRETTERARRSPFPGPNRLKRRDERGLSNSSTDSEPPHRRHSTDDDVEVFAAESEEMRQDQTQGLLAGETLGKQQSESSNLMNNIKDLIQEGILSDCTSRKCISCSTGKLALAACQASLDGWDWKCNKCVCRLSVRLDSAIVESSISLAQFHKLYKYFKEDACLETVSSELQMSVSDVKSIFDNLHKEAAAGGTKIKSEEQAVLLKIETPEKAPFFECGIVKVKTEQLDGSENQLFKEDPTGKLCQAHAKPNFSLSVQCPYKALVGEELCKVHDNRARLKLTRAFLSTGSRKSDLMKTTKPRKPPAKKEKEEKEAKKADKVEENLPFDEDEDSTNLVVVELEDCEDSPALHETGASFTSPVQSSTVEVMSTTELPVTAPPVTSSLTTSPKLARSVARSDATPDHVSSSRDETNMHVTTNTISEEQRSAEVRPAVLFQSETLELFDVEKYNVANDSDLHVLPKVVDKVRMMGEDMSLDEYLVVFWKNTLKLHTRQDLEDFMTYLLKLDLLETRMSILSDKKQRHYEDEVDQALNKLDIFSLLILHNFALLPESYRCLDSRTSLRLCKIIHTRSTPLPDREKDKVESIVTASYEPFDTSYLFKLRTLTHKQRNIAPTMVIEAILSHRFLAAPPFQKLRLANQYLSHIQSLDKCPDPLWPDYQTVEGDSSKDVMIRTLKVFFCNLYSSSCRENRTSGKAVKFLILKVLRQEIDVETLLFELKVVTNSAEPPPHVLEYLKDSVPVLRGEMFKQLQSKAEEHVNDIAVLQTHLICTPLRKMVGSVYLKCASDDTPDKNKTDSNESGDRQQTDSSESGDKAAQVLLKQFVSQLTAEEKVDLCKQFSSSGLTAAFPSKDIQTGSVGEVSSSVQDDVKIQTVSSTTQCEELETSENEVQCNFEDHHWVPMMDDSILHFPPHVASTDRSMIPVLLKYENLDKINEKFKSDNDITMGRLQNEIRRRLLIKRELEERDANIKRKREEFIRFNKSKGNYPDRNERIFPRVKQEESS